MIEKVLSVKDEVGLHARPASLFVKLAQEFDGSVIVKFNKVNKETGMEEVVEKDGKNVKLSFSRSSTILSAVAKMQENIDK